MPRRETSHALENRERRGYRAGKQETGQRFRISLIGDEPAGGQRFNLGGEQ